MTPDTSRSGDSPDEIDAPRYDDWPIADYDDEQRQNVAYVAPSGTVGGEGAETAVFFDEEENRIFEAEVDEDAERLVPREDSERELSTSESIGEALEDVGDRLHWDSLSAFAREHLVDEEARGAPAGRGDRDGAVTRVDPSPETVEFDRSKVAATADHDLEFVGSHTVRAADDRVFVVERTFEVFLDDPDDPRRATVDVTEQLLQADEPAEERRRGDATIVDEGETSFAFDLESAAIDTQIANVVEQRCREWHESHLESVGADDD